MIPDNPNQNQFSKVASVGKKYPWVNSKVMPKKITARKMRITLTDSEPTLLPAFSKKSALPVQQNATAKAAISPMCD